MMIGHAAALAALEQAGGAYRSPVNVLDVPGFPEDGPETGDPIGVMSVTVGVSD